jgi:hypothetical protein
MNKRNKNYWDHVSGATERFRDAESRKFRLTLEEFRSAVRLEALKRVTVRAEGCEFVIDSVSQRGVEMPMAMARGRGVRRFRSAETALMLLREMGLTEAVVDMSHWTPRETPGFAAKRPDVAARLAEGHAAVRARKRNLPQGEAQVNREGMISLVQVMRDNNQEVPEEFLRMAGMI